MTSLLTQCVVVAGATGGMGRAIAIAAAGTGASVLLFGRDADKLQTLKNEINARRNGKAAVHVGDATSFENTTGAVNSAITHFGHVDAIVNAVGKNVRSRALRELDNNTWREMLRGNLDAAFALTQAILPHFRKRRSGLITHISSVAALRADGSGASYQASKAAVAALARATMVEEACNGVRVSVVYPGFTNTAFANSRPLPPTEEELENALSPEHIAEVVLMLLRLPVNAYIPELTILPSRN